MSNEQFSDLADRMEQRRLADRLADLRAAGSRARAGCIVTLPDDVDVIEDCRDLRSDLQYLTYLAGHMDPRD